MEDLNELFEPSGMSDDDVLREYIKLDQRVKEAARERSWYASMITQRAAQERGNLKTVHLETADQKQKVKCEFKTEWKVTDASDMEVIRELLGQKRFEEIFKVEYTPRARAIQSFLASASSDEGFKTAKQMVKACVIEEDKTPSVSVEKA